MVSKKRLGQRIIEGLKELVQAEKFISKEAVKNALKDTTLGATGDFAEGYRQALNDVKRELGLE